MLRTTAALVFAIALVPSCIIPPPYVDEIDAGSDDGDDGDGNNNRGDAGREPPTHEPALWGAEDTPDRQAPSSWKPVVPVTTR